MNQIVQQLADQLGIDPAQAEAGVGAFLNLVQEQSPEQFEPLVNAVPGGAAFASNLAPAVPAPSLSADGFSGVGELLGGLLGGGGRQAGQGQGQGGGLDDLLGGILGGGGGARQPAGSGDGSGGGLDDLLGGILGGGGGARPQAREEEGGLGGLLGGILGGGGGGGAQPAQAGGAGGLLAFLATLLRNGFSLEKAAQFLPLLLALLKGRAGSDVLGGVVQNVPLLKEVLGGAARQRGVPDDDGFGLDDLLGQVLGRR